MLREPMSANESATLINNSLRAVPDLREIAVVVMRLARPDSTGCNWAARQGNTQLNPSSESVRLIEEIVRHATRHFNLFEVH